MNIKALFLFFFVLLPFNLCAVETVCPLQNGINVLTAKKLLHICNHGAVIKAFKVALGYNGVGKRRHGDNKTPLGLYSLAYPRKSNLYDVFIPILYPTASQAAAGFTGRDVGIHGPTQSFPLFSWINNLPGSTRGCIAVGTNHQIEYVANWIKSHPGTKILIV